jgi:hypothetical protein
MPDDKLDAIFREGAGAQWDGQVIDAFFRARNEMRAIAARNGTTAVPDAREFT